MQVSKELLKGSQTKLTMTLSWSEVGPYLDRAAKKISENMSLPGFRPGHAPRAIVEERVGAMAVLEEALNLAMPKAYAEAIKQAEISPVGQPTIAVEKAAPENDFVFSATVDVLPEIQLPDVSKLKVKQEEPNVDDKKVDETLEMLRERRAAFKPVERAAQKGDSVLIDFVGRREGVKVEGAEGENHPLELGSKQFVPGFEEALEGLSKDGKKQFTVTFPKDYHKKELANVSVDFEVTVKEVSEKSVPALDDAFAKSLGAFENLEAMKKQLRENLQEEEKERIGKKFEQDMLDAIVEKVHVDLPEGVVEKELNRMMADMRQQLEAQGGQWEVYLESIHKTEEDFRKEQREHARKRVLGNLVVYQITKEQGIEATEEEVDKEHQEAINRYQFNKQVLNHVKSKEYREYLHTVIQNRKTLDFLIKAAGGTPVAKRMEA